MSQEEVTALTTELKKLPQGYLPEPIFNQVARIAALTAIEFIPLRKNNDTVEVLLFRRASDDPFWPSLLHTPGTIVRASDVSFDDAYNRLFTDELNSISLPVEFFGNEMMLNNRGRAVVFKYIVDVTDIQTSGDFYAINSLPEDLLAEHRVMIKEAVDLFNKRPHHQKVLTV